MSEDPVLFLIDSEFPLNKIEEQLKNLKSFKIISFDFISHTKLQNLDLVHTISDIYLNDKEIVEIQHHVYSFLKWYDDSKISKYLLKYISLIFILFFVIP